jgi:tRNA-splicing ligase RtcB
MSRAINRPPHSTFAESSVPEFGHFGSRGLGHKIATWFLKAAGAKDGMDVEPCVIPTDTDLGAQYLDAMHLAGEYAYAGRDWVCKKVAALLGAKIVEEVHNHDNFAWR